MWSNRVTCTLILIESYCNQLLSVDRDCRPDAVCLINSVRCSSKQICLSIRKDLAISSSSSSSVSSPSIVKWTLNWCHESSGLHPLYQLLRWTHNILILSCACKLNVELLWKISPLLPAGFLYLFFVAIDATIQVSPLWHDCSLFRRERNSRAFKVTQKSGKKQCQAISWSIDRLIIYDSGCHWVLEKKRNLWFFFLFFFLFLKRFLSLLHLFIYCVSHWVPELREYQTSLNQAWLFQLVCK